MQGGVTKCGIVLCSILLGGVTKCCVVLCCVGYKPLKNGRKNGKKKKKSKEENRRYQGGARCQCLSPIEE